MWWINSNLPISVIHLNSHISYFNEKNDANKNVTVQILVLLILYYTTNFPQ